MIYVDTSALVPAFIRGVLCNALVCLAAWLTFSARTTLDRVVAIIPPVTLGNIGGGGVMVGAAYWFVYLRKSR